MADAPPAAGTKRKRHSCFDDTNAAFDDLMQGLQRRIKELTHPDSSVPPSAVEMPPLPAAPVVPRVPTAAADVCVVSFDAFLCQGALLNLRGLLRLGVDIVVPYAVLNLIDEECRNDVTLPDRNLTAPIDRSEIDDARRDPQRAHELRQYRAIDSHHSLERGNAILFTRLLREARNWLIHIMLDAEQTALDAEAHPEWARKKEGRLAIQQRTDIAYPPGVAEECWCTHGYPHTENVSCPAAAHRGMCVAGSVMACAKFLIAGGQSAPLEEHEERQEGQRRVVLVTTDPLLKRIASHCSVHTSPLHLIEPAAGTSSAGCITPAAAHSQ